MSTEQPSLRLTLAPLPSTRRGYGIHVKVSPKDNRMVYTNGRLVILRSLENPSDSLIFSEHKANVTVAAFSPSGYWVASGDEEGNVIVWSYPNMKVKSNVKIGRSVLDIDWDADSQRVVAVGDGAPNKAKVFQYDSGNNLGEISMHNLPILACAYRKVRPFRIATASEDLSVNFYEGPPFKYSKSYKGHTRYPNSIRYSPDGKYLVSVGADQKIVLYDGGNFEVVKEISSAEGHKGTIYAVSWSGDSKQLLTVSADKTAKIWDVESSTVVKTFTLGNDTQDMQVGCLWHNDYLITVSLCGAINYLDLENPSQPKLVVHGHQLNITSSALDAANQLLYTSSINGEVCRWDLKTGTATWMKGKNPGKVIQALTLNADNTKLLSYHFDDKVRVQDVTEFSHSADGNALGGQPVAAVAAKKSNLSVVVLVNDKAVLLRDGVSVNTVALPSTPTTVALSLDETKVFIGFKNNQLIVYNLNGDSLTQDRVLTEHDKSLTSVSFSPDARYFLSTDKEASIYIRDAETYECKNRSGWRYHPAAVQCSAFSSDADSLRFATGSMDTNVFIWSDFKDFSGSRTKIENVHTASVEQLAWLDATSLVTISADRVIRLFNVPQ